jgi:hypothetical protein
MRPLKTTTKAGSAATTATANTMLIAFDRHSFNNPSTSSATACLAIRELSITHASGFIFPAVELTVMLHNITAHL